MVVIRWVILEGLMHCLMRVACGDDVVGLTVLDTRHAHP